jgi:hypothetical protein
MKTHRFDGVSFFSGLIITAIGLVFLIAPEPGDIFDVLGGLGSWFWPVLLLAIGIAVLVPALVPSRDDDQLPPGTD